MKKIFRRAHRTSRSVLAALALSLLPLAAWAAEPTYPARPISLVVPYPPGGAADTMGRTLSQRLGAALGVTIVVDNRSGANSMIGAEYVARAPKDGYTLFLGTGALTTTLATRRAPPISLDALQPLVLLNEDPMFLMVGPGLPVNTLAEFIARAKAEPGKVTYATNGIGGTQHLLGEKLAALANVQLADIPYRGSAPAWIDLLGGRVSSYTDAVQTALPYRADGRARALAVSSAERVPQATDVPTFKELGYPDLVVNAWYGVFAPAGTPPDVVERLDRALQDVIRSPEFRAFVTSRGSLPASGSRADFEAYVTRDLAFWKSISQRIGLQLD